MKMNGIAFLLSVLSVFFINASQELEQMIIKTDVEGIKKLLPTIKLNSEAKTGLIELANDIVLMRLRTVEIYSCKSIGQADLNVLEESLSKETIEAVNDEYVKAGNWEKRRDILLGCFCISFLMAGGIGHAMEEVRDGLASIIGAAFATAFIGGGVFAFKKCAHAADMMREAVTAQATKIRNNLQKNYADAILVKQLIINVQVAIQ